MLSVLYNIQWKQIQEQKRPKQQKRQYSATRPRNSFKFNLTESFCSCFNLRNSKPLRTRKLKTFPLYFFKFGFLPSLFFCPVAALLPAAFAALWDVFTSWTDRCSRGKQLSPFLPPPSFLPSSAQTLTLTWISSGLLGGCCHGDILPACRGDEPWVDRETRWRQARVPSCLCLALSGSVHLLRALKHAGSCSSLSGV